MFFEKKTFFVSYYNFLVVIDQNLKITKILKTNESLKFIRYIKYNCL